MRQADGAVKASSGWRRLHAGAGVPVLAGILLSSAPGRAQITLDGSTGPAAPIAGPNHVIGSEAGQVRGTNLFHSFGQFNLRAGESAIFTGPSTTVNIISRVTGGVPSSIDGTIDSRTSMPSANLFLLNPNGVMLGPNARLNIGGSFHASTADYVRFADGAQYFAGLGRQSTLTVAEPTAFGFLGPSLPAAISVNGSELSAARGKALSLVGGNIQIVGSKLVVQDGEIHVNGEGVGELPIRPLGRPSAAATGVVEITRSTLDVSGDPSGTVRVRGGQLVIDGSSVTANTSGNADGARVGIDLQAIGRAALTQTTLHTQVSGNGAGGDIQIVGSDVSLVGGAVVSQNVSAGTAAAGNIVISTTRGVAISNASVVSQNASSGAGGAVRISAPALTMTDSASVQSSNHVGHPGDIDIQVERLSMSLGASVSSLSSGPGAGGNLTVHASESALIADAATGLSSTSSGDAAAGEITAMFGTLVLTREAQIQLGGPGGARGGKLEVTATRSVTISDRARVSALAAEHDVGSISVETPELAIDNGFISTTALVSGSAGSVSVIGGKVTLTNGGQIVSATMDRASGAAGNIALNVDTLRLDGGATIVSTTRGPGNGGSVHLQADRIDVASGASVASSTSASGRGGDISLSTPELVIDNGFISTTALASGSAGGVVVSGGNVSLTSAGQIVTATMDRASGAGGSIVLDVDMLTIDSGATIVSTTQGAGNGGGIDLKAVRIDLGSGGSVASTTFASGQGSDVSLSTPELLIDNGFISTAAFGSSNAGSVSLSGGSVTLINGGQIVSASMGDATGAGGTVNITATGLISISGNSPAFESPLPEPFKSSIADGSSGIFSLALSTNAKVGPGGAITASAPTVSLSDGGKLLATTTSTETGGSITLDVSTLTVDNGASITTSTVGAGGGGAITLDAGTLAINNGASIATSTMGAGGGGAITLDARTLTINNGASIATSTAGAGSGGVITLDAGTLTAENGASITSSTAGAGAGGHITVTADRIDLVLGGSVGSTSSADGRGGDISLKASQVNIATVASVSTSILGNAPGGSILVGREGTRIVIQESGAITANKLSGADQSSGGAVTIRGASLTMDSGAFIQSLINTGGKGGDVSAYVDSLTVTGGASLLTTTVAAGAAGNLTVTGRGSARFADRFSGLSSISLNTDVGPIGDVVVSFGTVVLTGGAQINAGSFAGTLGGGKLQVTADSISISEGAGISNQALRSDLGSILISTQSLRIDDGFISASTVTSGRAGSITLHVGNLQLVHGGQITTSSLSGSTGATGNIEIVPKNSVTSVTISGRSPSGRSSIPSPFKLPDGDASSGIFSTSSSNNPNPGRAGSITVSADRLTLADGGKLSVASTGAGAAGAIDLRVGTLTVAGGSVIASTASGTGRAGDVSITANTVSVTSGGRIDSGTTAAGRGGMISLAATNSLSLSQGAGLFSNTTGSGVGGDINVAARHLDLTGASSISASSAETASAPAGNVRVVFGDSLRIDRSSIATKSQLADGGNITITSTGSMLILVNGQITTSVASGSGSGGKITIGSDLHPLTFAILADSQLLTTAVGGDGGDIDIFTDTFLASDSLVDASSRRGDAGTINIESRITDLSGSLADLPEDFLQTANLLRAACAARVSEGKASSLVVTGREGVPPEPGGLLASPLGTTLADLGAALSEDYPAARPSLQLAGLWAGSNCAR